MDVPTFLAEFRAFTVQSASPCKDRIKWVNKHGHFSMQYFMKQWSLPELIIGRVSSRPYYLSHIDLHLNRGFQVGDASEADLEIFYRHYAPLACAAFPQCFQAYEDITELAKLMYDKLSKMVSSVDAFNTGLSHHLLVCPGSNRSTFAVDIPSHYLFIKLRDHLHIRILQEAAKLYDIFVCNSKTKGTAGHIFEDVHNVFYKGGEWRVVRMTQNKVESVNMHFKSPASKTKCFIKITNKALPQNAEFAPLARRRCLLDQNITLENGYYQPAPGQVTFDSLIYDQAGRTATMLQMAVATHHNKTKGVEWLMRQGVTTFYLVAVKPPSISLDDWICPSRTRWYLGLKKRTNECWNLFFSSCQCLWWFSCLAYRSEYNFVTYFPLLVVHVADQFFSSIL